MQPMQDVYIDAEGVTRFRKNKLVEYLLDHGGLDMNALAMVPGIPDEDREQFAQLIGYSVNGYSELSYVSDASYEQAVAAEEELIDARITHTH